MCKPQMSCSSQCINCIFDHFYVAILNNAIQHRSLCGAFRCLVWLAMAAFSLYGRWMGPERFIRHTKTITTTILIHICSKPRRLYCLYRCLAISLATPSKPYKFRCSIQTKFSRHKSSKWDRCKSRSKDFRNQPY